MTIWSYRIARLVTAHCKAATDASMASCLSALLQAAFTAVRCVRPALQGLRTVAFLLQQRRRRRKSFVPACAAGRRQHPILPAGAERPIPSLERLPSLQMARLMGMLRASKRSQNGWVSENVNFDDYSFSIWVPRRLRWRRPGVFSLLSNSFTKQLCP